MKLNQVCTTKSDTKILSSFQPLKSHQTAHRGKWKLEALHVNENLIIDNIKKNKKRDGLRKSIKLNHLIWAENNKPSKTTINRLNVDTLVYKLA